MNPLVLRGIRDLRPKHLIAAVSPDCLLHYLHDFLPRWCQRQVCLRLKDTRVEPGRRFTNQRCPKCLHLCGYSTRVLSNVLGYWTSRVYYRGRKSGLLLPKNDSDESFFQNCRLHFGLPQGNIICSSLPSLSFSIVYRWKNPMDKYFAFVRCIFCSVILYHLTAHTVGLVVPKQSSFMGIADCSAWLICGPAWSWTSWSLLLIIPDNSPNLFRQNTTCVTTSR